MPNNDAVIPRRNDVEHARRLAQLLDSAIVIPGTDKTIGIDALLGLVPVVGDVLGTALSSYLVYVAAKAGVPFWQIVRMLGNIATDQVVGMVPVVGDLFDFAFKANARNAAILTAAMQRESDLVPRTDRDVYRLALGFTVIIILVAVGSVVALALLLARLFR